MFLSIVAVTSLFSFAVGDNCTDSCDQQYATGIDVTMCGTEGETHVTKSDAFYDNPCYDLCGIMTYYEGVCGCPHNCYSEYNRGSCTSNSVCQCSLGWGGEDCSLPVSGNQCSLHGKLISLGDKDSVFPFEYCACDHGFTGTDCSSPELALEPDVWGNIYDVKTYYDDEYEDDHPVWNISVIATVRIEIKEEDYLYLLAPENLYTEDYAPATIHFDNGHVQESIENVGLRVKGQGGRIDQKKGWSVKYNKFVSGQKFLDIEKLNFKGCSEDDSFMKIQLATEMYKAMGVPSQRSSYALIYINSVFTGLYFMHEDISDHFIDSRFAGDGSGNMMQLYYNVHFGYYGPDDTYYREKVHVNALGYPMHYYSQEEGNDNWSDFISWLEFFNTTSDEDFFDGIEKYVDTDTLFRLMAVEAFLLAGDNLASGNNMYVYHQTKDEVEDQMSMFTYDYESVFIYNRQTNEPEEEPDIFKFFLTLDNSYDDTNPLLNRLLTSDKYRDKYIDCMSTFITTLFGSNSAQQPADRFASYFQFLLPWAAKDKLWQLSYGITVEKFIMTAEQTIANLPVRYQNVSAQIKAYEADKADRE
jgi:hypothetical protein